MPRAIDHDRCSELLRPYARGELDAGEHEAVASHLETCDECPVELAALSVLVADEADRMDPRERRRLHAAVDEALPSSEKVAGLPARRTWSQRFAPSLGAAALLLVALVVALSGGRIGGGGGDEAGTARRVDDRARGAGGEGGITSEQGPGSGGAPGKPEPEEAKDEATETLEANSGARARAPKPVFRSGLVRDLDELVETRVVEEFADHYTVFDAEKRSDVFLQRLSANAPSEAREQVETCGRLVDEASDDAWLPAAGAYGHIQDRPSLVLSFVYSDQESGPLSSYMVWAWPRGSCSDRLDYKSGALDN